VGEPIMTPLPPTGPHIPCEVVGHLSRFRAIKVYVYGRSFLVAIGPCCPMPGYRDFTTDASEMETLLRQGWKTLEAFPAKLARLEVDLPVKRRRVTFLSSDPGADAELDLFFQNVFRPALQNLDAEKYSFGLLQDRVRVMREVMQGQAYSDALAICDDKSLLPGVLGDLRSKSDAGMIRNMLAPLTPGKPSRWGATQLLSVDINVGVLACVELDQRSFIGDSRSNAENPLRPCTVLRILDAPIFGREYVVALLAGGSVEYRLVGADELFMLG
jgi:hypothetical protein